MRLADHFFYSPHERDGVYHFDADEARHAVKALRLRVGDGLRWVDGAGGRFAGRLRAVTPRGMTAVADTREVESPGPELTLGVGALHDASRLEWLVEKAVELGVTQVAVLRTERVGRSRHRIARLLSRALAAMKQSGRSRLPTVGEEDFEPFVARAETPVRLVAHCDPTRDRSPLALVPNGLLQRGCTALIGPEGDFTLGEIERAAGAGFREISLGSARLRTETAAIAVLAAACGARTLPPDVAR